MIQRTKTKTMAVIQPAMTASEIHKTVHKLLEEIQQFKESSEFKTIQMNLMTVSREVNSIRIKEITGEIPEIENNKPKTK